MEEDNSLILTTYDKISNLEEIGEGAFGKVYKAHHSKWNTVAFKEVKSGGVLMKEIEINKLTTEATVQIKLKHPNVLKLLGLIYQREHYGLVLEYMDNGDMSHYLSQNNVEWDTKSRFCTEISSGMKYLHSQKPPIIHGDLKMKNVLVSAKVTAVICDFGFSQMKDFVSSQSTNNVRSGTITHIPPEHWENPHLRKTETFDVYGFGILLWEMAAEERPFSNAAEAIMISVWVVKGHRPDETKVPNTVPKKIKKLMIKCWNQKPKERPTFDFVEEKLTSIQELSTWTGRLMARLKLQPSPKLAQSDSTTNLDTSTANKYYMNTTSPKCDFLCLKNENLSLLDEILHKGYFSTRVCIGSYVLVDGKIIHCAVKYYDEPAQNIGINSIIEEAQILAKLDSPHIVKIFGVVESNGIDMLVMELAPLGTLNKYLQQNRFVTIQNVMKLMHQVATGMSYMESKKIVHRNLRATNVVLLNEQHAKIISFGRSRALGEGIEYAMKKGEKCPVKWTALDSIESGKFDSKSDIWSYGITLWEAVSYGDTPYADISNQSVVDLLRNDERMAKPDGCPEAVYNLMLKCWQGRSGDRPTFVQICQDLKTLF